ncbi:MAG: response regulator, partial [Rhodospirillaceae bacterium]|nr:response regulator [Rhodospirillaceae bacterium]
TLALIGHDITMRRALMLAAIVCLVMQAVQYTSVPMLRFGAVGFTSIMMTLTAVIFFTRSRSLFYVLAGMVSLMRASNSAAYVYMLSGLAAPEVLPNLTSASTIFVNLAMGLCLLLITFDNAQKVLKKANDAQREAQQLAESLYRENATIVHALDTSQDRIVIEDASGIVVYANSIVIEIWGDGNKANVIGKHFYDAFPSMRHLRERYLPLAQAAFARGDVLDSEFDVLRPDGRHAHNEVRIMPLPDGGLIYTVKDVTDIYRREQREQQLKQQLIEAQRLESVGRLAGGVAHDFNNIIAAIRAFASLIADALTPDLRAHSFAHRIVDSCDRASELVRQILLFSRASQADLKPIPVSGVIAEVHQYVRANMPANIGLKVETPRKYLTVRGNTGQLIQVFMNLVINARDAVGGKDGRIQIFSQEVQLNGPELDSFKPGLTMAKSERDDGVLVHQFVVGVPVPDQMYVCVTVRDSGVGMSGATMERMFEPFFTTKEKARGTGLGLPVVAAVITAHSGFIVVDSKEGHGTRVRVYLPLTDLGVEGESVVSYNMAELSGHERILLVDDEVDLADATALLLSKFGYETAPLHSGKEALEIFSEDPTAWDVVITDQVMPNMTGLELIGHIKKIRADIPIILCTGFSEEATEQSAKAAGAAAFFNKPVRPEDLAMAIRKVRVSA